MVKALYKSLFSRGSMCWGEIDLLLGQLPRRAADTPATDLPRAKERHGRGMTH